MSKKLIGVLLCLLGLAALGIVASWDDEAQCAIRMNDPALKAQMSQDLREQCEALQKASCMLSGTCGRD